MTQCEIATTEAGRRLELAPVLDILTAEPLREILKESVVIGGRLDIDAGRVERMSTPCIQVIIAGTQALAAKGVEFKVVKPTEAFMNAFYELGLFHVVADWNIEQ